MIITSDVHRYLESSLTVKSFGSGHVDVACILQFDIRVTRSSQCQCQWSRAK